MQSHCRFVKRTDYCTRNKKRHKKGIWRVTWELWGEPCWPPPHWSQSGRLCTSRASVASFPPFRASYLHRATKYTDAISNALWETPVLSCNRPRVGVTLTDQWTAWSGKNWEKNGSHCLSDRLSFSLYIKIPRMNLFFYYLTRPPWATFDVRGGLTI